MWEIRKYKETDEEGIAELSRICEGGPKPLDRWGNTYTASPFGYFIAVVESEGKIIGHMASVTLPMKIGQETKLGSRAEALMVHPNFRRKGIFLSTGKFLTAEIGKEKVVCSYCLPNEIARSGHLKYGWFDVCYIPLLARDMNPLYKLLWKSKVMETSIYAAFRSFIFYHKRIQKIAKFLLRMPFMIRKSSSPPVTTYQENNTKIRSIKSFDNRINNFWESASTNYGIAIVRNAEYLNWRYSDNRYFKYRMLIAEKKDEVLGYVILGTSQLHKRVGMIVDLLTLRDDGYIVQQLISESIKWFRNEGIYRIDSLVLGNKLYLEALLKNGFHVSGKVPLLARVNSQEIDDKFLRDFRNWYLTFGDY
jgi:GNAT superfamily N-acetyltransferase